MNALVRSDMCDDALIVFEEMISRKLEPGLVACNFVLTNFSKHRKGKVALEFLEVMKKVRRNFVVDFVVSFFLVFSRSLCVCVFVFVFTHEMNNLCLFLFFIVLVRGFL